jgi:hypothetical protein
VDEGCSATEKELASVQASKRPALKNCELRLSRAVLFGCGLALLLLVAGCSPPDQTVLDNCHKSSVQRAKGYKLTSADLGELAEACMAERGYTLKKSGSVCSHNLQSENDRRCYYPDTLPGRLYALLPEF